MNRGTVVFLALAILLAHTLAIHQTPAGDLAPPYEIAHVAYRLGRNLAYDGAALWNPRGGWVESYPSPLWILVSALAARLYVSPTILTQAFGVACALATVVVLAQFSVTRMAGLIAPMLLAASGAAAAAAASGTEAPLAMLLATSAFLAFERGHRRLLGLVLTGLVLVRPEGLAFLAMLILCESFGRPRSAHARRRALRIPYLFPLVTLLAFALARRLSSGLWLSPFAASLSAFDIERWRLGAEYLGSFLYGSGHGLLVLALVASVPFGRVPPMALRATLLCAAWFAAVALSGGDGLPFWNALAPVLPLLYLAIQACLRAWMDKRPALAYGVWPLLLVSVIASFLVSKVPGDLGPIRLRSTLETWLQPRGELARAYGRSLGRLGLMEEIRSVESLRPLGVFLRDRVDPDATILSFWPGAIGYLSRKEVFDVLGRVLPPPGERRARSWSGVPEIDVIAALQRRADYLVPMVGTFAPGDQPNDFLQSWLVRYDVEGVSESRLRELVAALRPYELACVPVPITEGARWSERPFALLRHRELALTPHIEVELDDGRCRVLVRHEGHQQIVDLTVSATASDGTTWSMRPTGEWVTERVDARLGLLLHPTGSRAVELVEADLPARLDFVELVARLHNPGMPPDVPLSSVGEPYVLEM